MRSYYVYILASQARGTLYIGVTNNLGRRYLEHIQGPAESFTRHHKITRLVYYEQTASIETAIHREKQLKSWRRQWKINLIESANPTWRDLGRYYGMDPELNSG